MGFEAKGPESSPELRPEHYHGILLPCFLRPWKWGMGWVVVGTAGFGAPRFCIFFVEKCCIFLGFGQKSGRPESGRSYHHPSHPRLDALWALPMHLSLWHPFLWFNISLYAINAGTQAYKTGNSASNLASCNWLNHLFGILVALLGDEQGLICLEQSLSHLQSASAALSGQALAAKWPSPPPRRRVKQAQCGKFPRPIWLDDRGAGQWKWTEEAPHRTSLVPLASPYFLLRVKGVEPEGPLDNQGGGGIISIVRSNLRPVIFGVDFSSVFNSYLTFRSPGTERPREPLSRLFSDFGLGGTISCDAPYSAIGFRGKFFLQCPLCNHFPTTDRLKQSGGCAEKRLP